MSSHENLLSIVSQLQESLARSLISLEGRPRNGLREVFNGFCARHIDSATKGFVVLKDNRLDYAARLLVRPALEAMFKLLAVKANPGALYGIALYEHNEDKKGASPFSPENEEDLKRIFSARWEQFAKAYQEQYPDQTLIASAIGVRDAARIAGVDKYYESHYRLYCQYTHAALRASSGELGIFPQEDERVMGFALIQAIEAVQECGVKCDQYPSLVSEYYEKIKQDISFP